MKEIKSSYSIFFAFGITLIQVGHAYSESIIINVRPEDSYVFSGNTATFFCGATLKETIGFQSLVVWLKDDSPISNGTEARYIKTSKNYLRVPTREQRNRIQFTSSLIIENATESDSGEYSCVFMTPGPRYRNINATLSSAELTVLNIHSLILSCRIEYKYDTIHLLRFRSNCNDTFLTTYNLKLKAYVVLQGLEALKNDDKYDNTKSYSEFYALKKTEVATTLVNGVEKDTTHSDWVAIIDKYVNVTNRLLTYQNQRRASETVDNGVIILRLLWDIFDLDFHRIQTSENITGSFYHSKNNNSVDSNPITVVLGKLRKNNTLDFVVSDEASPYQTSISGRLKDLRKSSEFGYLESSESYSSMNYVVIMIKPLYLEYFRNIKTRTSKYGYYGDLITKFTKQLNGKIVVYKGSSRGLQNDRVKIKFAHIVKAVYNPNKVFRRKLQSGEIRKAILGTSKCGTVGAIPHDSELKTNVCRIIESNHFVTHCECEFEERPWYFTFRPIFVVSNFHDYLGKDLDLKILTWILWTISVACLLLSLSSFLWPKRERSPRREIIIHLCVILIGGNILLLLGDKDNLHLSDATCTALGMLNHFAWLSAFSWMAVEGIDLYLGVIKSISPTTNHLFKIYCGIGYGIPLLTVVATFTIGYRTEDDSIYVGEMFCWLQDNYIWGFGAPTVMMVLVNIIFALMTYFGITMTSVKIPSEAAIKTNSYRKRIIKCIALTVIMVLAWISGVLTLVDYQRHSLMPYLFQVFTASQGIFIFVFHSPWNKKTRFRISKILTEAVASVFNTTDKKADEERSNEMKEIYSLLNGSPGKKDSKDKESTFDPASLIFDDNYEIPKYSFIVDPNFVLGKGEFGEVCKGNLRGREGSVAFKTSRPSDSTLYLRALVSEVKIHMHIGPHENVVSLLGVYRQEIKSGVLYVAMEFCEFGSLHSFLSKNKHLFLECPVLSTKANAKLSLDNLPTINRSQSTDNLLFPCSIKSLLKWSGQIANAMEYLNSRNVVHSDLATRNVLLNSNGDAKVTDFGLSRRTYNYSEYIKTAKDPLPWRWLAIECLQSNIFSCKSDVWAYGVTLWEIYSLGRLPYPGLSLTMEFVDQLQGGLKNSKPKYASDEIYNVMMRCWQLKPDNRPAFSAMQKIFEYAVANDIDNISSMVLTEESLEKVVNQLTSTNYTET